MKLVPAQWFSSGEYFCTGQHLSSELERCAECGVQGHSARHMFVEGLVKKEAERQPLCQECYETYAGFLALEKVVGV